MAGQFVEFLCKKRLQWEVATARITHYHRAIPKHGKLLVIELVLPPSEEPFIGKRLNLHRLVLLCACAHPATEYAALFHATGFELTRVIPTPAEPSVVEAAPV